jgi:hypothetical protein
VDEDEHLRLEAKAEENGITLNFGPSSQ